MKRAQRLRRNRNRVSVINGFRRISHYCWPVGYYKNRPHVRNPHEIREIGSIESFRFILS